MPTEIRPTFHCFDDALDFIELRVNEAPGLAQLTALILVHGIATSPAGEPYAHAWCEEDGQCWDAGLVEGQRIFYSVSVAEFYAARQIHTTTRYTIREAFVQNVRSNHFGPWEQQYQALCGGGHRILGSIEADTSHATARSADRMTKKDLDLDAAIELLERAAADAPTLLPSGKFLFTPKGTCRVCGCTDEHACPGGCVWAEPNLCSRCALVGR